VVECKTGSIFSSRALSGFLLTTQRRSNLYFNAYILEMSTSSNGESRTFIDSNLIEQESIKKHKGIFSGRVQDRKYIFVEGFERISVNDTEEIKSLLLLYG
jgi:hypothetical protein